jgi:tetratricopeptide (TPR) repeat protein
MTQSISDDIYNLVEDGLTHGKVDDTFFDRLLLDQPYNDYLIGMRGYYLAWNKKYEMAENFLIEKINLDSTLQYSTFINLAFGTVLYYKGQTERAKEYYDKSLEYDIDKKNKWIRLQLYYFHNNKDIELGKKFLFEALDICSDFTMAKIELANVNKDEGKFVLAEKILKAIIADEQDSYASYCLGLLYVKAENYIGAKNCFQEAIEIKPFSQAYAGLGYIEQYYLLDNDAALISYDESIKLDSKYALPYFHKGVIFLRLKQYDNAVDNFNIAINLKPDEKSFEQLIYTHALMKDYLRAKEINDKSLILFGHYTDNDFWEILLLFRDGQDYIAREKIKDFHENYSQPDVEWLEKELSAWGITDRLNEKLK